MSDSQERDRLRKASLGDLFEQLIDAKKRLGEFDDNAPHCVLREDFGVGEMVVVSFPKGTVNSPADESAVLERLGLWPPQPPDSST